MGGKGKVKQLEGDIAIREMRDAGHSYQKIGEEVGLSREGVRKRLLRMNYRDNTLAAKRERIEETKRRVAELLAEGFSHPEIAHRLNISYDTVRDYVLRYGLG